MVKIPWAPILEDRHIGHLADALHTVDLNKRVVATPTGHGSDTTCWCLPWSMYSTGPPGTLTLGAPGASRTLGELVADLRAGAMGRVAFVVPAGITWTLPLYELVLLAAGEARRAHAEAQLLVVTTETEPLEVFGSEASETIRKLLAERSIGLRTGAGELRRRASPTGWLPCRCWRARGSPG